MKTISFFILVLVLASCDKDPTSSACQHIDLDSEFEMTVGASVCLPDDRSMRLIEVRDEFCPCYAICVWEGQLILKFEIEDFDDIKTIIEVGSSPTTPNAIFEDISISNFGYLYNNEENSLPDCEGSYNEKRLTALLTLSQ